MKYAICMLIFDLEHYMIGGVIAASTHKKLIKLRLFLTEFPNHHLWKFGFLFSNVSLKFKIKL